MFGEGEGEYESGCDLMRLHTVFAEGSGQILRREGSGGSENGCGLKERRVGGKVGRSVYTCILVHVSCSTENY